MEIKFFELQNFRKLKSVRIDFSDKTTLCVGANNSGKTSAMIAMSHFLVNPTRFTTNDFTLSDWAAINALGAQWETKAPTEADHAAASPIWDQVLPALDLWLNVGPGELHFVRNLLPSLEWAGGMLGVRLRYEPKDGIELAKEYLAAKKATRETKEAAAAKVGKTGRTFSLSLWPGSLREFLDRKLKSSFVVRYYLLDPTKCAAPAHGIAKPQPLPPESEPLEGDPLKGLIRIDEISAQRGLGDSTGDRADHEQPEGHTMRDKKRLSEQLKNYYAKHLDPAEFPEPADLEALEAIETAQKAYDDRLATGFAAAIEELQTLNYPGVTDPRLRIATRLRPTDGMNHSAAVQYDVVTPATGGGAAPVTLPEEYNGLGYQNLISMVFKLMSYRDAWMRVGKAGKATAIDAKDYFLPPLHLVLVEEPEAYLHAQVQQVFLKKAYEVLRNHKDLGASNVLRTQLIVSTHSSHIAHECEFAWLRYFRRLPADSGQVPTSAVINLSEVFGPDDDTKRFVTRYLRATHCDLFFADAAILVEGPAERMLVPHFIRKNFSKLHCCFVTLLEIDGSHAHRLRPLIEHLGLLTLIITDIDSAEGTGRHKNAVPERGKGQITRNSTVKTWHPVKTSLDELFDLKPDDKAKKYPEMPMFEVRVAYQTPIQMKMTDAAAPVEALARTFEDSLVFENLALFKALGDEGGVKDFKDAINATTDAAILSQKFTEILEKLDKAAFALDLIWLKEPNELNVPGYIREGLTWLEDQLGRRHCDVPATASAPVAAGGGA